MLLHDASLERTTNGHGSVDAMTAAELAALDAGSWFHPDFANVRIPTLLQVLRHCTEHGIWLNVEIKPLAGREARTAPLRGTAVPRSVEVLF